MKMKIFNLLLFFGCVYMSACKSISNIHQSQIQTLPDLPPSEIDIPIKISAKSILAKAEQMVPVEFTSDNWPEFMHPSCDFRYKYRFVRTTLQFSCANNIISVHFGGNYQISGSKCLCTAGIPVTPWVSGSCGFSPQPLRKVNMALSSTLQFLPNYSVKTSTTVTQVQPVDKCSVSIFSNDITQLVMDSIRSSLVAFTSVLDKNIASLDISSITKSIKDSSFHKVALGQYGYFLLNPSAVRIGQLNYKNDSFEISVGLSCKPVLSSDPTNHTVVPKSLPPLLQTETRNGMRLFLNLSYDFEFLGKILHDSLYNRVFDLKGRTIVIKDVNLRGLENQQFELRIDFNGSNHGSILLRGTPTLDSAKQTLSIPDIKYSLEGEDLALKIAKSLFKNKIRSTLQGKSYLDVNAWLNSNKTAIDSMLNRTINRGIGTSGKLKDAKISALLVTQQGIQLQVFISGEMNVLVGNL